MTAVSEAHVVVVGASLAGLASAWEFAAVGMRVTVLDERPELPDADPAIVLHTDDDVVRFLDAVGAAYDRVDVRREIARDGEVLPLPGDAVDGIPANVFATEVRRLVGRRGIWRGYVDRLRPPLTIGHETSLDRLVRTRLGSAIAERMVAPIARALHGVEPDGVDVDRAIPGLNAAMTRAGSLSGGAGLLERNDERLLVRDLVPTLLAGLRDRDIELRLGVHADSLDLGGATVEIAVGSRLDETAADDGAASGTSERIRADAVVLATGRDDAIRLLDGAAGELRPGESEELVWTADLAGESLPRLIAFTDPRVRRADIAGGRVRIVARAGTDLSVDAVARDVLGLDVVEGSAAESRRDVVLSRALLGSHVADAYRPSAHIAVVGSWIAGDEHGLAHALAEGQRVRRSLLWGDPEAFPSD